MNGNNANERSVIGRNSNWLPHAVLWIGVLITAFPLYVTFVAPGTFAFALGFVEHQQGEICAAFEPLDDLETGGSRRPINEHRRGHGSTRRMWVGSPLRATSAASGSITTEPAS